MRWLFFDCDSTLSSIEGVDELARMRPQEVFEQVASITDKAMNGEISIDGIFAARLGAIQPTREDCDKVGQLYIDNIEPTAQETVNAAREKGWTPAIISGGFVQAIEPMAKLLGIERIEAVTLNFDEEGNYAGFDESHPNTRNGGKAEIIEKVRAETNPDRVVVIGDGISDLETKPVADLFVGFGGYVARERVKAESEAFITRLNEVISLL